MTQAQLYNLEQRLRTLTDRAVGAWGSENQLRMLQEECGECVAAVNRLARARPGAVDQLAEEVADVLIMAAQARYILGTDAVDAALSRKLARLEQRLDAAEWKTAP